jgi:hypothetical protein
MYSTVNRILHILIRINCNRISEGLMYSQDSSVSIVTRLRVEKRWIEAGQESPDRLWDSSSLLSAGCKAVGAWSRSLTSMQRQVQEYVDPYLHSTRLDGVVLNINGKIIVLWNVVSCSLLTVTNISEEPATSIFRTGDGAESHNSNIKFLRFSACFVSETTETDLD